MRQHRYTGQPTARDIRYAALWGRCYRHDWHRSTPQCVNPATGQPWSPRPFEEYRGKR